MKIVIITFLLFFQFAVYGQDYQASFDLINPSKSYKEGDIVEGVLRIWPIENFNQESVRKFEKTVFFNAFFLAEILSIEPSINNADVIEIKGIFVVKSAKIQRPFLIQYNEVPVQVSLDNVEIIELAQKSKDFYIMNQSMTFKSYLVIWIIIILILVVVILFKKKYLIEIYTKYRYPQGKNIQAKYDEMFRLANKRADFERIYLEKEKWVPLLSVKTAAHMEFFKVLNQYQFKKEWTKEELQEVSSAFEIIRRSFAK